MIQIVCSCGRPLRAEDDQAGQTIRCPECGAETRVPDGAGVQAAAPLPDPAANVARPEQFGDAIRNDRPLPPVTSGLAIGSLVLGLLSLFCNLWTAVPAVVLGAVALWDVGRSRGRKKGMGLAIAGIVAGVVLPILAFLVVMRVRDTANRISSANNLKQMTLAMHDYESAMGALPPAAICDTKGKPLLSWRVLILPYIEEGARFRQFKMDEPWDGPNNRKLLTPTPRNYLMPGDTKAPPGYTYYRVFVGRGAAFDPPPPAKVVNGFTQAKGLTKEDFPDGLSNTILIVEAAEAAPWTKPDELDYDPDGPLPPLGGHFGGGFQVALADGTIKFIPSGISPQTLRAAITRNGGEKLGPDW